MNKYYIRKHGHQWIASRRCWEQRYVYYTFPTWRAAMSFVETVLTGRAR